MQEFRYSNFSSFVKSNSEQNHPSIKSQTFILIAKDNFVPQTDVLHYSRSEKVKLTENPYIHRVVKITDEPLILSL